MKLVYPDVFPPFELERDRVNMIVVEPGALFYKMMNEFSNQCEGRDGEFVLSENNTILNISKTTDFITGFIPFDSNPKRLITKLYSKLESLCVSEMYDKTVNLRAKIAEFLSSACNLLDSDTEFDSQAELKSIFKCFDLKFSCNSERLSDKLINYLTNSFELDGRRLFVTVGLLNYLGAEEANLFFRTVTSHKFTLLMFENCSDLSGELVNKMTVDKDYCIF